MGVCTALASLLVLITLLSGERKELAAESSSQNRWLDGNVELHSSLELPFEMNSSTICTSSRAYGGRVSMSLVAPPGRPEAPPECDIFSGKWVYDGDHYPLYGDGECPYMSDQLACSKHGRPDREYQRWRWQPHQCDLKRYAPFSIYLFLSLLCSTE